MMIGARVKVHDRTNVLFSMVGEVQDIQAADYPWRGPRVLVATDDGRKGLFSPEELRAA